MRNRLHRINNCKFNSNYRFMRSIFNKRNKQATTNDVHHSGPKSPNEMQQNTTSPNNIYADGQSGQNQSNPESIPIFTYLFCLRCNQIETYNSEALDTHDILLCFN
eukprot:319080_1